MPAAVGLDARHVDLVGEYTTAMRTAGRWTGRSTLQAARTFRTRLERVGSSRR